MKRTMTMLIAIPLVVSALIVCLQSSQLSYLYCLLRERELLACKTRSELELRLFAFYSVSEIDSSKTVWNLSPPLNRKPHGKDCTVLRYLIFDKEPLDVMVARDGTIVDMFCAYE